MTGTQRRYEEEIQARDSCDNQKWEINSSEQGFVQLGGSY